MNPMSPEATERTDLIEPAERIRNVEEYYFSTKLKQVGEMRRNGIDVINLGIGSPDLSPSTEVIEALHSNALNPQNHGYQSYIGIPVLRNAFTSWYKRYFGVTLNPENEILPLMGSKEGIMHISMAFLNNGNEVLIPNPGYPAYEAAAKLAGGKARYYDLIEENSWLPDLNKLGKEELGNVKIMWVNYPHMPTGARATPEFFSRLVAFGRKHKILVCNDNPYSFILNDHHISVLSAEGAETTALELNSLSKSHNMAGWRIGMVAGNSTYISAILRVKSNMDSGMFQPLQAAAAEALNAPDSWYKDVNAIYSNRRTIAEEIMNTLRCTFDREQTGLFLWGKIPSHYTCSEDITEPLLLRSHVFITPGRVFGSNGKNYLRISLCADEKRLSEANMRIKRGYSDNIKTDK